MNKTKWNPGWEEFGAWVDTLDMTGPTPGLLKLTRLGIYPFRMEDLEIDSDRDRLLDDARD